MEKFLVETLETRRKQKNSKLLLNPLSITAPLPSFVLNPANLISAMATPEGLAGFAKLLEQQFCHADSASASSEGKDFHKIVAGLITIVGHSSGMVRRAAGDSLLVLASSSSSGRLVVLDKMFKHCLTSQVSATTNNSVSNCLKQNFKLLKKSRESVPPCDAGCVGHATPPAERAWRRTCVALRQVSRRIVLSREGGEGADNSSFPPIEAFFLSVLKNSSVSGGRRRGPGNLEEGWSTVSTTSSSTHRGWPRSFTQRFKALLSSSSTTPDLITGPILRAILGRGLEGQRAVQTLLATIASVAEGVEVGYDVREEGGLEAEWMARDVIDSLTTVLREKVEELVRELERRGRGGELAVMWVLEGRLVEEELKSGATQPKPKAKARRGKGDFGATSEIEEWEQELRAELSAKKAAGGNSSSPTTERVYTPTEQKTLASQSSTRAEIAKILDTLNSIHGAIASIIRGSISVSNDVILRKFSGFYLSLAASAEKENSRAVNLTMKTTTKSSLCALLPNQFFAGPISAVVNLLSSSILEVSASATVPLSRSLILASTTTTNSNDDYDSNDSNNSDSSKPYDLQLSPHVSTVVAEIDEFGGVLSSSSFLFVLPVLLGVLTGPRTLGYKVDEATMRILVRQFLGGQGVERLRVAQCLLDFLEHDRAKGFNNPNVNEVLEILFRRKEEKEEKEEEVASDRELDMFCGRRGGLSPHGTVRRGAVGSLKEIILRGGGGEFKSATKQNRGKLHAVVHSLAHDENPEISAIALECFKFLRCGDSGGEEHKEECPPPTENFASELLKIVVGWSEDNWAGSAGRSSNSNSNSNPKGSEVLESSARALAQGMSTLGGQAAKMTIDECVRIFTWATPTVFEQDKKRGKGGGKKSQKELEMELMTGKEVRGEEFNSGAAVGKNGNVLMFNGGGVDTDCKKSIRSGICVVLSTIGTRSHNITLDPSHVVTLMEFFSDFGLADPDEFVRGEATDAGRKIVATHGGGGVVLEQLLAMFKDVLGTGKCRGDGRAVATNQDQKINPNNALWAQDFRKEGSVILLGSAALHLNTDNPGDVAKITETVTMLLNALKTPSENVQRGVADCLVPLMKKMGVKEGAEKIVGDLLHDALQSDSLATRRGSAYGLSAVVKGLGISSLKKYEIVKQLEEGCGNSNPLMKEGSLFCVELLCSRLGMLFEPYVIVLLSSLLKCFGDSSDHVRAAASTAASLIMNKLSSHGVKLIMPSVLTAFEDSQWRTKQASIRMLGSMSNCAPKQLASCLPKIVPKLTEAFSDTHPKVKDSASLALQQIISVIRNPEVKSLSKILLRGLTDPAGGTKRALAALLETEFLHAIDAPSLALLIPILQRGLKDRVGTSKRQSALICGNMCTMISSPDDFSPYLSVLLPGLKSVLLDPIPDVRSTSAKALGALVRGLGESALPDLRPWLIDTLKSETGTGVERSGAAQGLTELLVASGGNVVNEVMMDEIFPLAGHPRRNTREGVLWVLTFLPTTLGQGYSGLIEQGLKAILNGLNDEAETVREVALRGGKVLIRSHGRTSINKIVPPLEDGLEDDNWRIRQASLSLLGDLLTMIGGTNVVGVGEVGGEDDTRGAEKAQAQIALVLGKETRKRVLSKLYIARSDTSSVVRQGAVQVWKSIVNVTPRTLHEILPLLVSQIVGSLSAGGGVAGGEDRTTVASRCLGDLVRKLGEKVLPEIVPILKTKLQDVDEEVRVGVCVGLAEIISCGTKEQIVKYLPILIPAVRGSLVDTSESVRKVGAVAFQKLYLVIGGERVFSDILPKLMEELDDGGDEGSLEGLKEVLKLKSRELLPMLVPKLMQQPITEKNAVILGSVAEVIGGTVHFHFQQIVGGFSSTIAEFDGVEGGREDAVKSAFRSICKNVGSQGVNWLIVELAVRCGSDKEKVRVAAVWMVGAFAEERKEFKDFNDELPILIRECLNRLNDDSKEVIAANVVALKSVFSSVAPEEITKHLDFSRNLINSLVSEARRRKGGVGDGLFLLPGFNIKSGLDPLLPMLTHAILYGTGPAREIAAACLGEFIELTDSKFLAGPVIIKMTGPLIRVVGDRNTSSVKGALVKSLGIILSKGGPTLKAFVPQLQTTFVKALSDPMRAVRLEAIKSLSKLMPLSPRVDPLINDLVNLAGNVEVAIKTVALESLSVVMNISGKKIKNEDTIDRVMAVGVSNVGAEDAGLRESASRCIESCYLIKGCDSGLASL